MNKRQGCNDIVRAMLANEVDEDTVDERDKNYVSDYSEKLYPFLDKLCKLNGLKISEDKYKRRNKDKKYNLNIAELDDSTYTYFKEKMVELSLDFGIDNIHKWIPSVITINKADYDLFNGKWAKSQNGVLFMYRLNSLLFEVAGRQNPKIKDKSYYDRLRDIQRVYGNIFNKSNKESIKEAETGIAIDDSETMYSYLEKIEKKIEDRRNGVEKGETISLIRIRDNILMTMISSYRRKNANGCYNKEIKKLKEKLKNSGGYIFPKDYFIEYLKLSIINDEFQFPNELYGANEEIYYRCRDKYKNNPSQDIDKMIHDIIQSVNRECI